MSVTTDSSIRKVTTKSALKVASVAASKYQKEGTLSAELHQSVTTVSTYPSKRVDNSLQDNIFSTNDFGFGDGEQYTNVEKRVAWINVPENSTPESVIEQLKKFPTAGLYRILSSRPILSDSDKYAIGNSALNATLDAYANRQAVRYPDNHPDAGKLALDSNGKVQYRRIAFKKADAMDVDTRTMDFDDMYMSPEIEREFNGVVEEAEVPGQEL